MMEPLDICNNPGPLRRFAGVGAAAGIGVDALVRGRRTIYESPRRGARLDVMPLLNGVRVSLRF